MTGGLPENPMIRHAQQRGIYTTGHFVMSGSLAAACFNVSVGMCVYWRLTFAESWPTNSIATASLTPAAFKSVVAVCRSE